MLNTVTTLVCNSINVMKIYVKYIINTNLLGDKTLLYILTYNKYIIKLLVKS